MRFTKLLFTYVSRYFIGFLIIYISSILVAAVAGRSIETYMIERGEMENREGIDTIRDAISKMDLINQMTANNQAFTTIVYQKGPFPQNDVLKLREANQMLTEIGFAADYIPYVFMLFRNNDLYLSTSQCSFRFQNYYGQFLTVNIQDSMLPDSESVREFLFSRYTNHSMFTKADSIRYVYNEKEQELNQPLLYVTSRDSAGLNPMYLSCFVIDRDYIIKNIMMPELKGDGFLYIQDSRTGEVLLEYGDVPEKAGELGNGQTAENGTYHVMVNTQEELKWKIVTGLPMAFIQSQLEPVNRLLVIYLCIGMLLVIELTLCFSLRRYAGIKRVLFAFPFNSDSVMTKSGFDEYRLLTDNILTLKKKGNDYRLKMEQLAKQNEAILLEHLMIMGIRTREERSMFEKCFEREPEFFCVAVVRFCRRACQNHEIITLDMAEYLKKHYDGMFTNVYSGVSDELFLFELDRSRESNVQGIKTLFEEITAFLMQEYDVTFHVGISAIGTDISNINKCYEQARQIMQAQYAHTNQNMVKTYDISLNAMYENPVNLDFLTRLHNLVICGQQKEIEQSFDKLQNYYCRMPYLYEVQKVQIYYSIRNVLYSAWLNLNCETSFTEVLPSFSSTMACETMMNNFAESTAWLCEYMVQAKKSKNEGLKQRIIDYLYARYQDTGLSAYGVSKEIGISEKYLSQFIKEQTGETFSAYLLNIRITRAKEYLRTTDCSNDKIAEMTGFGSVNTFYRNFKEQTGVTPRVYKDNYKQ